MPIPIHIYLYIYVYSMGSITCIIVCVLSAKQLRLSGGTLALPLAPPLPVLQHLLWFLKGNGYGWIQLWTMGLEWPGFTNNTDPNFKHSAIFKRTWKKCRESCCRDLVLSGESWSEVPPANQQRDPPQSRIPNISRSKADLRAEPQRNSVGTCQFHWGKSAA